MRQGEQELCPFGQVAPPSLPLVMQPLLPAGCLTFPQFNLLPASSTRATLCPSMPDQPQTRLNHMLWTGLVFFLLAIFSNLLYFFKFPAASLPWLNLILPVVALCFVLVGLLRAFAKPQMVRGKIWGSILAVLALLLVIGSTLFFIGARKLPHSLGAPQIGQRAPDFTLPDSTGQPTSLAQLFAASGGAAPPKAVLLVFYRGYW